MQSAETTFAGVDQPPSIFPGVIFLGSNKSLNYSNVSSKKGTKNENTAMSEQAKVEATAMRSRDAIKPAKDRVESSERRCNDSTCSFWLACLFLSNPTCFSLTYQLKSFRLICHK